MSSLKALRIPDSALFFSKQDPQDPRLGEIVRVQKPMAQDTLIIGWPDDEGIRMNGGRPGAAEAPDRIRKYLYRMTPPVNASSTPAFCDLGNLEPVGSVSNRHAAARQLVQQSFQAGHRVLTFGGGHDYGFPDAAGFLDVFLKNGQRPAVINFDAHLDVRPTEKGFHSGTPFRRLLEEFPQRNFDFLEIGLQPQCNSRDHWKWAQRQGAELWMADEVREAGALREKLSAWMKPRPGHPVFISFDMDAVTSVSAPGCSQSWDRGLSSDRIFESFAMISQGMNWRGLGIYEVSPPLDQDDRTSKLAAQAAFDFLAKGS